LSISGIEIISNDPSNLKKKAAGGIPAAFLK
jgi:hypothetical protein